MQVPSEEDVTRDEGFRRRAEEHMRWKQAFFQSRPPPPFVPQKRRRRQPVAAAPVHTLYKRAVMLTANSVPTPPPPPPPVAPLAADSGMVRDKREAWAQQMQYEMRSRNPYTDVKISSDPRRTVVVSRLHPKTLEEEIRLFGEQFGRVVSVRLIFDLTGKSRKYAFIQFGLEAEAHKAVANSYRRRLHGRAVVIDMERGRLEPFFLPKRMQELQRQDAATNTQCGKCQGVNERPEAPSKRTVGMNSSKTSGRCCDEIDVFLDDIINLT